MLKCYNLADGRVVHCPDGETGMIQIYSDPTDEEKCYLVEKCGIDSHTLASALDEDEISRLEFEDNHVAVIMKRPKDVGMDRRMEFRVSSVGAFLFPDRIIVVQTEDMPLFEHGRMPLRGNSVPGILLRLLHQATRHFLQHLRIIRTISEQIEKKIEYAITNKSLVNMFSLLKSLTYYESAIGANMLLLGKLRTAAERIGFQEMERELLEDISIENKQCDNLSKIYSEILSDMSNARVSIVNNTLSNVMKYLAVINLIFMPINVLTGSGGMSEFSVMTQGIWWPYAYSGFFLFSVVIAYITFLVVKRVGVGDHK